MGRLIDADVLIKAIQQHMVKINSLFEKERTVVEIIDAQPTAYDIEKVVAELEEEKEISCADFTKYVNEYNPCLDDEYDDFFHKGLERAIVIIGKGGAE